MLPTALLLTHLIVTTTLGLPGDPIAPEFIPFLQTGCIGGPPIPGFDSAPEGARINQMAPLTELPMSGASLRFFITTDGYRGDGLLMVQIDSGLRRSLGADGKPFLLATVGHWGRTCTVRMPLEDCPAAIDVREQLKALQIPVGYGFEMDRLALHATGYTLQIQAYGVHTFDYAMPGNPLEAPLDAAREALRACWQPALDAVRAGQVPELVR